MVLLYNLAFYRYWEVYIMGKVPPLSLKKTPIEKNVPNKNKKEM